jgi:uncharacterized protein DUF4268
MDSLGKLVQGNLSDIWRSEAFDFTKWLAQKENLELLGDEVGIQITLLQTEANVGNFNVDILAKEIISKRNIIIETQLEITDHNHLGKIITYASGFDASIIIWIVKDVREEHKRAIDWLNEHTDEEICFFIVKMELWKINDSPYAPKFHIISEPNDWAKAIKKSVKETELSETQFLQLEYWKKFKEYGLDKNTRLKLRNAQPQHWFDIAIGNSESQISLTIDAREDSIGCELYLYENNELFGYLYDKKAEIEAEIGAELDWMELRTKKASRIKLAKGAHIQDTNKWNESFEWMFNYAEKFYDVFSRYIKDSSLL